MKITIDRIYYLLYSKKRSFYKVSIILNNFNLKASIELNNTEPYLHYELTHRPVII